MRVFIAILVLIFSLQSWTKAEDISDFQIEGMSIGDSLLDFISKDKIEHKYKAFYPKSEKYYLVEFDSSELEFLKEYSHVSFHLKNNNDNFIIYAIKGMNIYDNNLDSCLKKKKTIVNSISKSIVESKEEKYENSFNNAFGKSKAYISDFKVKDGFIRIWCTNWDKKTEENKGWRDTINVNLSNQIFLDWLNNEAYK